MKKIEFKNIIPPDGHSIKIDENRWRVIIGSKTEISFKNKKILKFRELKGFKTFQS